MKQTSLAILAVLACMMLISCRMIQPKQTVFLDINCVVETEEPNVIAEITLDGDLVFSGKTHKDKSGNLTFFKLRTSPGEYDLIITAPEYATWKKTITILAGNHEFWAKLKKE